MSIPFTNRKRLGLALVASASLVGCASQPTVPGSEAGRRPVNLERPVDHALSAYLSAQWARQQGRRGEAAAWLARAAGAGDLPHLYEEAVDLALKAGRPDKAAAYAEQWARQAPERPGPRTALARAQAARGKPRAAARALVGVAADDEPDRLLGVGAQLARAAPRGRQEDWRAPARGILDRWVQMEPGSAWPYLARGHFLAQTGDRQAAASDFRRALEIRPEWELAVVELARTQPMDKAVPELREFLGEHPEGLLARRHLAEALLRADRTEEARQAYQRLIDQGEDAPEIWLGLGLAHFRLEEWQGARTALKRALAKRPGYGAAQFFLGRIAEKEGSYQRAANLYGQVSQGRYLEQSRLREAIARLEIGQAQRALRVAQKLRRFREDEPGYYQLEARILLELNRPERAAALASKGLRKEPDNPVPLRYLRAMARERLGRYEAMEADIRAILEREPKNADALNFLGFSLADRGARLGEARQLIQRANELRPNQAYIVDSLGWVHYRLGNLQRAHELLQRAVDLNGEDAEIYLHLGVVRAELGNRDGARQAWQQGLEHVERGDDLYQRLRQRLGGES